MLLFQSPQNCSKFPELPGTQFNGLSEVRHPPLDESTMTKALGSSWSPLCSLEEQGRVRMGGIGAGTQEPPVPFAFHVPFTLQCSNHARPGTGCQRPQQWALWISSLYWKLSLCLSPLHSLWLLCHSFTPRIIHSLKWVGSSSYRRTEQQTLTLFLSCPISIFLQLCILLPVGPPRSSWLDQKSFCTLTVSQSSPVDTITDPSSSILLKYITSCQGDVPRGLFL